MKTWIHYAMAFGIFASFMAATNPAKEDYLERTARRLTEEICTHQQLPRELKLACSRVAPLASSTLKPLISAATRRQNYLLFSIYTTELGCIQSRSLGLGGQFLPIF